MENIPMPGSEMHSLKNTLKAHPEGQTLHSPAVTKCTQVSEQRAAVSHSTTDMLWYYHLLFPPALNCFLETTK